MYFSICRLQNDTVRGTFAYNLIEKSIFLRVFIDISLVTSKETEERSEVQVHSNYCEK